MSNELRDKLANKQGNGPARAFKAGWDAAMKHNANTEGALREQCDKLAEALKFYVGLPGSKASLALAEYEAFKQSK